MLDQAIEIAQLEDSMERQVKHTQPEFKVNSHTVDVPRMKFRRGAKPKSATSRYQQQGQGQKTSTSAQVCRRCGGVPSHSKKDCPVKGATCYQCSKIGHYGKVDTSQFKDCVMSEEAVFFQGRIANMKAVESVKLPAAHINIVSYHQEAHNAPLWLRQELTTQVFQNSCEVDSAANIPILALYKAKQLFSAKLKLLPPTVTIYSLKDHQVENLGPIILFLYYGSTRCSVV